MGRRAPAPVAPDPRLGGAGRGARRRRRRVGPHRRLARPHLPRRRADRVEGGLRRRHLADPAQGRRVPGGGDALVAAAAPHVQLAAALHLGDPPAVPRGRRRRLRLLHRARGDHRRHLRRHGPPAARRPPGQRGRRRVPARSPPPARSRRDPRGRRRDDLGPVPRVRVRHRPDPDPRPRVRPDPDPHGWPPASGRPPDGGRGVRGRRGAGPAPRVGAERLPGVGGRPRPRRRHPPPVGRRVRGPLARRRLLRAGPGDGAGAHPADRRRAAAGGAPPRDPRRHRLPGRPRPRRRHAGDGALAAERGRRAGGPRRRPRRAPSTPIAQPSTAVRTPTIG